jgi:DNA primase
MPLFPPQMPQDARSIVLVEGIFDMLNLYDKGLQNVVCCFGTNTLQSETKEKLMAYKAQGITHVYILFDGDDAGAQAAKTLKPLIEQSEFVVEIVTLPDNVDPGELDQFDVKSIAEYIAK